MAVSWPSSAFVQIEVVFAAERVRKIQNRRVISTCGRLRTGGPGFRFGLKALGVL